MDETSHAAIVPGAGDWYQNSTAVLASAASCEVRRGQDAARFGLSWPRVAGLGQPRESPIAQLTTGCSCPPCPFAFAPRQARDGRRKVNISQLGSATVPRTRSKGRTRPRAKYRLAALLERASAHCCATYPSPHVGSCLAPFAPPRGHGSSDGVSVIPHLRSQRAPGRHPIVGKTGLSTASPGAAQGR
jgi:hypothetical protein